MLDQPKQPASQTTQELSYRHREYLLGEKPISSLKAAFSQWIRSLPMQQRFLVVKIEAPGAQQMARKMFSKGEIIHCQASHEQKGQATPESRRFCKKYEKIFFDSLVFVSDGQDFLDHVCFDYSLLESPEKLFDLLMVPCDGFADRTLGEVGAVLRQGLRSNSECKSRNLAGYELFSFLRGEVLANFLDNKGQSQSILKCLEEQKKRKKEFSNNWKFSSEENRMRILLLGRQSVMAVYEWMIEEERPISLTDLEKEIEDLMKLEKNEFCNRVFKCKLKKISSPIINYYESLYVFWKGELEKGKKKRGKFNRAERDHNSQQKPECKEGRPQGRKPNKKGRKSNSLQSNQTNQTDNKMSYAEKKQSLAEADSTDFTIKKEEMLQAPKKESQKQATFQKISSQTVIDESNPQIQPVGLQFYDSPKKSTSSSSTSTKMSSKSSSQSQKQPLPQTFIKQHIREATISKLYEELQQISDRISEQANEFHDRRVIAFQRIQFLLQYYSVPIKLFGSCASGIAVRNSDIDIAIDNCIIAFMDYLPENERIRAALERLEELFQTQKWITEIKFIKTAAIPVIKMTINTDIEFLDPSIGAMYFELNRKHNSGIINADITVETKNNSEECSHLGLISTTTINRWIGQISSLHSIIITMKEFFSRMRLNCTYEGGLNTFSMIVLLVAYISHAKLEKEENAALVLERILRFYTEEFDEKEQGIDILNAESGNIYYIKNLVSVEGMQKGKQKADLEMKDPMNQQKNMTRNCYSFPEIKKLFKLILQGCYARAEMELQVVLEEQREPLRCLGEDLNRINKENFQKRNLFIELLGSLGTVF